MPERDRTNVQAEVEKPFPASLQAVEWAQVVDDVGPVEEPKQPGTALSFQGPMALAPLERKDDGHHPSAAYLPAQRSAAGHAVCSFELHGGPPAAATLAALSEIGSEVKMDLWHHKRNLDIQ